MSILKNTPSSNMMMITDDTTLLSMSMSMSMSITSRQLQQQQQRMEKKSEKTVATRRVRFNKAVKVKRTRHINNYTDAEIEACWYTPMEYSSIQERMFMTLDLMKLSSSSPTTTTSTTTTTTTTTTPCIRGLENYVSSSSSEKHKSCLKKSTRVRRRNALWAVLNEQDRQWYEMVSSVSSNSNHDKKGKQASIRYDDIKIKDVYKKYTRISEDIAHSMGRIDASCASSDIIGTSIIDSALSIIGTTLKAPTKAKVQKSPKAMKRSPPKAKKENALKSPKTPKLSSLPLSSLSLPSPLPLSLSTVTSMTEMLNIGIDIGIGIGKKDENLLRNCCQKIWSFDTTGNQQQQQRVHHHHHQSCGSSPLPLDQQHQHLHLHQNALLLQ